MVNQVPTALKPGEIGNHRVPEGLRQGHLNDGLVRQEPAQELCKLLRVHVRAIAVRHGNHDARALGHTEAHAANVAAVGIQGSTGVGAAGLVRGGLVIVGHDFGAVKIGIDFRTGERHLILIVHFFCSDLVDRRAIQWYN